MGPALVACISLLIAAETLCFATGFRLSLEDGSRPGRPPAPDPDHSPSDIDGDGQPCQVQVIRGKIGFDQKKTTSVRKCVEYIYTLSYMEKVNVVSEHIMIIAM